MRDSSDSAASARRSARSLRNINASASCPACRIRRTLAWPVSAPCADLRWQGYQLRLASASTWLIAMPSKRSTSDSGNPSHWPACMRLCLATVGLTSSRRPVCASAISHSLSPSSNT